MYTVNETKQPEADLWTWIVIGLVFSAVIAALYGPFVWEHWEPEACLAFQSHRQTGGSSFGRLASATLCESETSRAARIKFMSAYPPET